MSDHNPYAPPKAEVRDVPLEPAGGLASRGLRLTAAIVDAAISLSVTVAVLLYSGYLQRAVAADSDRSTAIMGLAAAALVSFVAINGTWLAKYGQTVGKRVVRIRIVNVSDGRVPRLATLLGRRYGTMWLVSLIPSVSELVLVADGLLILRADRRCLHDLIAGTKVVVI